MSLKWRGPQVAEKLAQAAREGVNATMGVAVLHAKENHSFQNRTGTAERSIRIAREAETHGHKTSGLWGSVGVLYFVFLEFGTALMGPFPTLRPAAAAVYPELGANIRRAAKALGL